MNSQAGKWSEDLLIQTLKEIHESECIPAPERRTEIRARLVISVGVNLYAVETRLGWMGIARTERGIRHLALPRPTPAEIFRELQVAFPEGIVTRLVPEDIERELNEYAQGRRRTFDTPLDLVASPFKRAVLEAISKIPFGETRSYGWVAQKIGHPKAARAVGQALHTNPIPIILPCHRVIASNGSLGGYGGGLPMKQRLLALEGVMHI